VLHLSLALYIISFSMGIAVLILSFFAFATYRERAFLRLALLFGSIEILLVVSVLTTYDRVVPGEFGQWLDYAVPALSAIGYALFAYSLPMIVLDATQTHPSPSRNAALLILVMLMAALGIFRDWVVRSAFPELTGIAFLIIQIYAALILLRGLPRIDNATIRTLFRQLGLLVLVMSGMGALEMAARRAFPLPRFFQEFPFVNNVAFLCAIVLLILFAARYLRKEPSVTACALTDEFVQAYGISPRECEIISMMIQGFNNRMIGERLFISAATVKNHVYHIYQKTGAANKVQLMNLINPPK